MFTPNSICVIHYSDLTCVYSVCQTIWRYDARDIPTTPYAAPIHHTNSNQVRRRGGKKYSQINKTLEVDLLKWQKMEVPRDLARTGDLSVTKEAVTAERSSS